MKHCLKLVLILTIIFLSVPAWADVVPPSDPLEGVIYPSDNFYLEMKINEQGQVLSKEKKEIKHIDHVGPSVERARYIRKYLKPYSNENTDNENLRPEFDNGKYGYKDKSGKFVIEPKFTLASYFNNGLAKVAGWTGY